MNRWQKTYCDIYYNGKVPKNKRGKEDIALLEKVEDTVTVEFPDFTGANGFIPAHTETFIVTENDCNIPQGKISVSVLVSNLRLWLSRGQRITSGKFEF